MIFKERAKVQEESLISLILFLTGQTIAIWKKLSKIEQKIDSIQEHNKQQDEEIKKLKKVIVNKINGTVKELVT